MQQIQKLFEFIAFSSEAKQQQQQEQEKLAGSGHTHTLTLTHTHTYILWLTHIQRGWVVMTQNIEQKKQRKTTTKFFIFGHDDSRTRSDTSIVLYKLD